MRDIQLENELIAILSLFECRRCATCCKDATVHLTTEELMYLVKRDGEKVFEYLDENLIENAFKPPCKYLRDDLCGCQYVKPVSCRLYPFAFVNTPKGKMLTVTQCPMGRDVVDKLTEFMELERTRLGISDERYEQMKQRTQANLNRISEGTEKRYKALGYPEGKVELIAVPISGLLGFLDFLKAKKSLGQATESLIT